MRFASAYLFERNHGVPFRPTTEYKLTGQSKAVEEVYYSGLIYAQHVFGQRNQGIASQALCQLLVRAAAVSGGYAVREFGRRFYSAPEISEANVQGLADTRSMTVEDHIEADRAMLGRFKAAVQNVYAADKSRCERGQDLAQKSYYAALNEGIDNVSGDPALEAVARAYRKCSDFILRMASYHRT